MTPEGRLKDKVTKFCKERGLHVIRLSFSRGVTSGWPDVIVLALGGRPLFLELKAPGKQPTELQSYKHGQLRDAGYDVLTADDFNAARAFIAQRMGPIRLHDEGDKMARRALRRRLTSAAGRA